MKIKMFVYGAIIILTALAILALRPLPKATAKNCIKHTGTVLQILPGKGKGDIVIKLANDNNFYYINRGLDNGLKLTDLQNKLVNQPVELLTIKHWTPLDPGAKTKHIAQLTQNGHVVYSELQLAVQ